MGIFLKDIQQFIDNTTIKEHKIVKEIVTDIIDMPIQLSPVDTGNFVSNWLLGLDKAVPWGVTGEKNGDKNAIADRLIAKIPEDAANHNYNLVNNTRYAQALEDGTGTRDPGVPYSRGKAPHGMIGVTKVWIPEIIRRVIARNK